MAEKFEITEKDEFVILKHWLKDTQHNLLKIPKELKGRITDQQAANLFAHYDQDNRKIENRVNELEEKFQKRKEHGFFHLIKTEFKKETAKIIVWIIMTLIGFVLGLLVKTLFP